MKISVSTDGKDVTVDMEKEKGDGFLTNLSPCYYNQILRITIRNHM